MEFEEIMSQLLQHLKKTCVTEYEIDERAQLQTVFSLLQNAHTETDRNVLLNMFLCGRSKFTEQTFTTTYFYNFYVKYVYTKLQNAPMKNNGH